MGFSLQSGTPNGKPVKGDESLDIYNPARISKRWDGFSALLETAPEDAAAGIDEATRFILSQLFGKREWRERHPRALTEGPDGRFARKLISAQGAAAALNLRRAFKRVPGTAILDFYVKEASLHEYYPAALLSGAQKRFVRWLFDHGRVEQGFHEVEILCFLQLCAENRAQMIATSYLLQPEWQVRFPAALTREGAQPFLEWLDEAFNPLTQPLHAAHFPPQVRTEVRFSGRSDAPAGRAPFNWRPARTGLGRWFTRRILSSAGVNVLGPLCFSGGVGQAARTTAQSLQVAGVPLSCRDIPASQSDVPRSEHLGLECFPTTIIHALPDAPPETLFRHVGWPLVAGKCRIGFWYWELETLPRQWAGNEEYLAEIWAPTRFVADAVRRAVSIPVVQMLPAVQFPRPGNWSRKALGLPEDRFVFLFMFDMSSTFQRKNPLAVIEAFRMAAGRDAALVIKVSRGAADPASRALLEREAAKCGALVYDEVMSMEKTMALIAHCDCYVSLHRSEGFGLTLAEAMLMGKPVIGTRYSGNLDFMNDGNSLLVDFSLVPVGPDVPIYPAGSMWAQPSVEHAAARLRWVLENRDAARALGEKARGECSALLSLKAYGGRMLQRLSRLPFAASGAPSKGPAPR